MRRAAGPLVLAIDVGTSSARAIVFDSCGAAVDGLRGQVEYAPRTDASGMSEFDADVLVESVARAIDEALERAEQRAGQIAAVGCTTFWHSMVGVNRDGKSVTPLYTWADMRAADAAWELRKRLDPAAVHARTGCAIHSSYFPARLLWLRTQRPDLFARVDRWLSPGQYLSLQLQGHVRCSISMASATGLFDQNRCEWDAEMLDVASVCADQLGTLHDWFFTYCGLIDDWGKRWPALARVPWSLAIGDGAASNLGAGCATDRQIAINLGTSGAIRVLWRADHVDIPPELWCYRLDSERFVMGGAFSDGGSDYAWLRRTLQLPADEEVERVLAARKPDSHGLTFLPFLAGERSVGWRPEVRGTLHGLSLSTAPLDMVQAVMEGIALRFALVADVLALQFPSVDEIRISGGAVGESPVWARMICDAIGRPVTLLQESEATARGAALVALRASGMLADEADAPAPAGTALEPDMARHEGYRRALERQQDLYSRLADMPDGR